MRSCHAKYDFLSACPYLPFLLQCLCGWCLRQRSSPKCKHHDTGGHYWNIHQWYGQGQFFKHCRVLSSTSIQLSTCRIACLCQDLDVSAVDLRQIHEKLEFTLSDSFVCFCWGWIQMSEKAEVEGPCRDRCRDPLIVVPRIWRSGKCRVVGLLVAGTAGVGVAFAGISLYHRFRNRRPNDKSLPRIIEIGALSGRKPKSPSYSRQALQALASILL